MDAAHAMYNNNDSYSLPRYFSSLADMTSPEELSLFASIEQALALLNFEDHIDEIDLVILYPDVGTDTQVARVRELYRNTIIDLMTRQGILMVENVQVRMSDLYAIFNAVVILATLSREDALGDVEFDPEDDDYLMTIAIFAQLTNLCEDEIMMYIDNVTLDTARYLRGEENVDVEVKPVPNEAVVRIRQFLSNYPERAPIVVNYIRSISRLDFEPIGTFAAVRDQLIGKLKANNDFTGVAFELYLYLLASKQSVSPATQLDEILPALIELLSNDPLTMAKLSTAVRSLMHVKT